MSVRTQTVEVCAGRQLHWVLGNEEPLCVDTHHDHRLVELHQHIDRVVLPNCAGLSCGFICRRYDSFARSPNVVVQ